MLRLRDRWDDLNEKEVKILHKCFMEDTRDIGKLDVWLHDARHCGLHAMRSFVRKLRQDIDAVRNAILEPWSNGQVEGQINRLKTLKRAMYGRASVEFGRPPDPGA